MNKALGKAIMTRSRLKINLIKIALQKTGTAIKSKGVSV